MELTIYVAKYFDGLAWQWRRMEVIAESEEQVKQFVDRTCPSEYRRKPYQSTHASDSLTIERSDPVSMPYVLYLGKDED